MTNLTIREQRPLTLGEKRIHRQLAQSTQRMQQITDDTIAAMNELSHVHKNAACKATDSLKAAERVHAARARGGMTHRQEAIYAELSEDYLRQVNRIVDSADQQIIRTLGEAPAGLRPGRQRDALGDGRGSR